MAMGKSPACSSSTSTTRTFFDFYGTEHRPRDTTPCKGSRAKHPNHQLSTSAIHVSTKSETPITLKNLTPSPLAIQHILLLRPSQPNLFIQQTESRPKQPHPRLRHSLALPTSYAKHISPRTRFYQARPSQPQPPARTPTSTYQPSQRKPPNAVPEKPSKLHAHKQHQAQPSPIPQRPRPLRLRIPTSPPEPNPTQHQTSPKAARRSSGTPSPSHQTHTPGAVLVRRSIATPMLDAKSNNAPELRRHPDPNDVQPSLGPKETLSETKPNLADPQSKVGLPTRNQNRVNPPPRTHLARDLAFIAQPVPALSSSIHMRG